MHTVAHEGLKGDSRLEFLRELQGWQVKGRTLELDGGWEGKITLTPALPGVLQVRLVRGTPWSQEGPHPSVSVDESKWPDVAGPDVKDEGDYLLAGFPGVLVKIEKAPIRLSYWVVNVQEVADRAAADAVEAMQGAWVTVAGQANETGGDGATVTANAALSLPEQPPILADGPEGGMGMDGWSVALRFQLNAADTFYGTGEADQRQGAIPFNHRGRRYPIWHKHLPAPSRMVVPVIVNGRGYGIFIDNPWTAELDFGAVDPTEWGYTAQGGQLTYYFIAGPALTTVVERYTRLTGRAPLAPKWTFGLTQSKFGYKTRDELFKLIDTFDEHQIPLDCVVLDLYWFKRMGDLNFDQAAFPDPKSMIEEMHRRGVKLITIEEPYLARNSRLFPVMDRLGLLGKRTDGRTYTFPFWASSEPGKPTGLVDFTQHHAKEYWAEAHRDLIELGIDAWWTDLNEPEEHPADMIFEGGPAAATHNVYAHHMLQSLKIAHDRYRPNERLHIMSRSGWPGTQALGASQWSGDVATRWDALANQIPLGLSMGMAGFAYWNTDVGGFAGERPMPELYARWVQFGAFNSMLRPHGAHQEREPWAFGPETEAHAVKYVKLRYRLLPYTYTLAAEVYRTGLPFMRPLVLHYQNDPRTFHLVDQFLWGRDLLVAPVVTPETDSRKVYLPEGAWYDFWTNRRINGGRVVVTAAPLDTLPLFVRAGSIIPMAPERLRTGEAWEEITLAVYPDEAGNVSFTLYEDDGRSVAYQQGAFALTTFTCEGEDDGFRVTIGAPTGSFEGQVAERSYQVALRMAKRPAVVTVGEEQLTARRNEESLGKSADGWWFDQRAKVLWVKLGPVAGETVVTVH